MVNLLEQGARVLHKSMVASAGATITYRRGDKAKQINAVPGRNPVTVYDERGAMLRAVVYDFIIARADMADFDPPEPVRNDQIIHTVAGKAESCLVNGDGIATSHFEPADSYGVAWRVHTKRDGYA